MRREFFILAVVVMAGCAGPVQTLRFHEEVPGNLPESRVRLVDVPRVGQHFAINPYATLSERDVIEAKLHSAPGGDAVLLKFDLHGANALREMTTRLRGQHFVVLVNDRPVATVLIEHLLTNGEFLLFGDLTDEETRKLVASLNKTAGRRRDFGDTQTAP